MVLSSSAIGKRSIYSALSSELDLQSISPSDEVSCVMHIARDTILHSGDR